MKYLAVAVLALACAGCGGFGQTFSRELAKQMADDIGASVEARLGDDFKGVGESVAGGIKAVGESIPKPEKPPGSGENAGAVLLALLVANILKFAGRRMNLLGAGTVRVEEKRV